HWTCTHECQSREPWKAGCRRSGTRVVSSGPVTRWPGDQGYGVVTTERAMRLQAATSAGGGRGAMVHYYTRGVSADENEAFYYVAQGDGRYAPTRHAQGAWQETEQHMAPVAGLL